MKLPRASGVLLHPTSLPGPHGSGDFGPSAYHFIDWLETAGQRLWQILPLNGIGAGNSPYMSSSAFAGNPLLIDLAELHTHGWLTADELSPDARFDAARIDFGAVIPYRMQRLAWAAQRFATTTRSEDSMAFAQFCKQQSGWLDDYALFMALSQHLGTAEWSDWPAPLVRRDAAALEAAVDEHAAAIAFWKFCQWSFFRQWRALRSHANARGVQIVGDAPIFIAHQSAEVWARQELFILDGDGRPQVVAGVPPDLFSATGQRWGNPLYRWAAHEKEGFAWWTDRIRRLFEMVDIVRIDHFRGFAAYWEIAASSPTAMDGRWVEGPGDRLFHAIAAALGPLPIIAEDLGLITPDVLALRRQFDFPGMCILQFAFGDSSANLYLPHNHGQDAVVYTGTHDNDTTLGWWSQADVDVKRHVCDYLDTDGRTIHWDLIRAASASVADTAIHPLQDVLGLDGSHRMNYPGFGEGYWEWRFDWRQVRPEHAEHLRRLTVLHRRDGTPLR